MGILAALPLLGQVLDRVIPDKTAAAEAKLKLLELEQRGQFHDLDVRASIVGAEAKSEHWLAACWRPVLMLTFGALIVARWLGFAAPGLSEVEVLKLWDIVEVGIGGYVVGRTVEKVIPGVTEALKAAKK